MSQSFGHELRSSSTSGVIIITSWHLGVDYGVGRPGWYEVEQRAQAASHPPTPPRTTSVATPVTLDTGATPTRATNMPPAHHELPRAHAPGGPDIAQRHLYASSLRDFKTNHPL
jgi:hypothetical protein